MVYLSRIYTKSGDKGETGLGDGSVVAKDHPRIAATGSVDELNAVIGVLLTMPLPDPAMAPLLRLVQNDLFDVGADLCVPSASGADEKRLRMHPAQAARLEAHIDQWNTVLQPLHSFVLPGGSPAGAWCHLARTVCRRSERDVVTLMRTAAISPEVLIYLNRLSDWLFVAARICNQQGPPEPLWAPGQSRPGPG